MPVAPGPACCRARGSVKVRIASSLFRIYQVRGQKPRNRAMEKTFYLSRRLAVVLVIGTLAVFFFPLSTGPFTVTNGPATAMRAAMAAMILLLSIAISFSIATRSPLHSTVPGHSLCSAEPSASPPLFTLRC